MLMLLNKCILSLLSSPPPLSQRLIIQYLAAPKRRIVLRIEINIKFASVIQKGHFASLVSWETQTTNPFLGRHFFFARPPFSHLFPSNFLYPSPGRRKKRKRRRETRKSSLRSSSLIIIFWLRGNEKELEKKIAAKNNKFSVIFKFCLCY